MDGHELGEDVVFPTDKPTVVYRKEVNTMKVKTNIKAGPDEGAGTGTGRN